MKRIISILAAVVLAASLLTCVTQTPKQGTSTTLGKLDFQNTSSARGAILNNDKYNKVAELSSGTTRGQSGRVVSLPASVSLKDFAPIPGNQGYLSSCTGWASAYAARTIIESHYLNRTDKILTTKMAFSPLFLYFAAREFKNVPGDEEGADPVDILNFMTLYGMPRRAVFDDNPVTYERLEQQGFLINPVPGFSKLFNTNVTPAYKIEQVKKSLADNNPVIIGICVPDSFSNAKDIWTPESGESRVPEKGHALCVVGYDDKKYGGAFEIMNSWGEEWGNNGFTWISYDTFGKWVEQALVINEDFSVYEKAIEFTGKIKVELSGKNEAAAVKLLDDGVYRLPSTVKTGTQIRLNIDNSGLPKGSTMNTYAFYTSGQNNKAVKINNNEWIKTDGSPRPENIVILYSRSALDIDSLLAAFDKQKDDIPSRLSRIIGKDFILFGNSKYEYSTMQIKTNFMNQKSVAGMVLLVSYDTEEKPIKDMVLINGGTFTMGSPASEEWHQDDEQQRTVTVKDFYLGTVEVTVADFSAFVTDTGYKTTAEKSGKSCFFNYLIDEIEERNGLNWRNPGFTQESNHPVVHISFYDAAEYCNWLSKKEGLTPVYAISGNSVNENSKANGYRIPTEAEWEYACRAGTTTPYNTGKTIRPNQANFNSENASIFKTVPVRKYSPNNWGLHNMHGNVFEWCSDNVDDNFHSVRGSTWLSGRPTVRSAFRVFIKMDMSFIFMGFRIARSAE
ncbi:hypothetical protein R84B8_00325 [Treponema sp. R8-4-B8]